MEGASTSVERVCLLGGSVDLVTPGQVIAYIGACVRTGAKAVIANHNFHSLYLARRSPAMAAFYEMADLIEADSTPLITWGRLLGLPIGRRHRCTYLDWREAFWAEAQGQGWRVFFVGGRRGVAEQAATAIRSRWPRVTLETQDGYFDAAPDSPDSRRLRQRLDAWRPDIVLVGMGMPRQEAWIRDNLEALDRGVLLSIGGAFDFEAGAAATPPRWMGRVGLEWAFRLVHEPQRLFVRYLVEPWFLLPLAAVDVVEAVRARPRITARLLSI